MPTLLKTKTKSGTNSAKILLGRNKEWPWQVFSGASPHPRLSSCEEFQTVKYLVKYAGLNLRLNLKCKNDCKDRQKSSNYVATCRNAYMMLRIALSFVAKSKIYQLVPIWNESWLGDALAYGKVASIRNWLKSTALLSSNRC